MNVIKSKLQLVMFVLIAAMAMAPAAFATSSAPDFSGILADLDVSTAVTAVMGAAALLALVSFVIWAAKRVAKFF